jgi:hypothetical protein
MTTADNAIGIVLGLGPVAPRNRADSVPDLAKLKSECQHKEL